MHDFGRCADHGMVANAAKLMETCAPSYIDVVTNFDVTAEGGMSARQEKVLREAGHDVPEQKRILELNAEHAVVQKLQGLEDEGRFADWSSLLYDQALLAEGSLPTDPAAFSRRLTDLMSGN